MIKKLIVTITLLSNICLAADVVTLKQNDIVPFDGVLFSHEREKALRVIDQNLTIANDLNKLYEEKIGIMDKRIELRDTQIDSLTKTLASTREDTIWTKIGFFILGAAVTTGIAYGVTKATR